MYSINLIKFEYKLLAIFVALALLLWTFGISTFVNNAKAASLTNVSDTLSDSDLSVAANHTISFTTPTGIAAGETITITFPSGFNLGSVAFGDVDLTDDGADQTLAATCSGGTWGAAVSGQVLTITSCTGTMAASSVVGIEIGTNATFGSAGANQITNPGTAQSYVISIGGTMADSADTRVAIIDDVVVTASVDTTFTFTVSGVANGQAVNGDATNTATSTTATTLPFETLTPGTAKVLAQDLAVTTNAANGFSVTIQEDQNLTSATGADIDTFIDGANTATPAAWQAPAGTLGSENTYGHFGITSEDADLNSDEFGTALYAGNFNTAREIFSHTGPADGSTANQGATRIGFKIEIDALQEAGNDYTNNLTYVATPTF